MIYSPSFLKRGFSITWICNYFTGFNTKDLANCRTKMVLLYSVASDRFEVGYRHPPEKYFHNHFYCNPEKEGTMGCFLHKSPKSYNNVF